MAFKCFQNFFDLIHRERKNEREKESSAKNSFSVVFLWNSMLSDLIFYATQSMTLQVNAYHSIILVKF